jgi:hypothetical protein
MQPGRCAPSRSDWWLWMGCPQPPTYPSHVSKRSRRAWRQAVDKPNDEEVRDMRRRFMPRSVELPPTYVLRRRHVEAALLSGVPSDAEGEVTLLIHSATIAVEHECFHWMGRVTRVLVQPPEPSNVAPPESAAVLGVLIATLDAHEHDFVDTIWWFVSHNVDEMHRIGTRAFTHCARLREVVLPRSITHIEEGAFCECTSLTAVTLPPSLTYIGRGAFNRVGLRSLTLPNSLTHSGSSTFSSCMNLTSLTLPDSLTHIEDSAFCRCTALKELVLPNSLTRICDWAFSRCTALKEVVLPNSVTHVGAHAFADCKALSGASAHDRGAIQP